jgi:carbon storage regulator
MLVIRRREGQSVLIGGSIEVFVIDAAAGRVKLGITAPREVPVLRSEIRVTGEQNRIAAQRTSAHGLADLLSQILKKT